MDFKKSFYWGASTASYQIEGAYLEDGKSLNIWDTFCQIPGRVLHDDNGDVGCDHYHHMKEDVALMKKIGLKAYRFSISWSRILPEGTGKVNEAGIKFYNDLIDELLANNIEPFMTLYHWDLPLALDKLGGWRNPMMIEWFSEYARVVAERFSDRVKYFMTINEPSCVITLGYRRGMHAPGLKLTIPEVLEAAHILLKTHGTAVQTLRAHAKQPIKIGFAPCGNMPVPMSPTPENIADTRNVFWDIPSAEMATDSLVWFNDPVFLGQYPEKGLKLCEQYMPKYTPDDMKLISSPIDFVGHNIYFGGIVQHRNGMPPLVSDNKGFDNAPYHWPASPDSLYWGTKFLYERYKKPIIITENGRACHDVLEKDGSIHDLERITFINEYLSGLKRSVSEGTKVEAFFYWSLMDNFEWTYGYEERFGLIYVDYETKRRYLKDSAKVYSEIIKTNGGSLH